MSNVLEKFFKYDSSQPELMLLESKNGGNNFTLLLTSEKTYLMEVIFDSYENAYITRLLLENLDIIKTNRDLGREHVVQQLLEYLPKDKRAKFHEKEFKSKPPEPVKISKTTKNTFFSVPVSNFWSALRSQSKVSNRHR